MRPWRMLGSDGGHPITGTFSWPKNRRSSAVSLNRTASASNPAGSSAFIPRSVACAIPPMEGYGSTCATSRAGDSLAGGTLFEHKARVRVLASDPADRVRIVRWNSFSPKFFPVSPGIPLQTELFLRVLGEAVGGKGDTVLESGVCLPI